MKLKEYKQKVSEILTIDDIERAHSVDDKLRGMFLAELAKGEHTLPQARDIAKELLKTEGMERWCA